MWLMSTVAIQEYTRARVSVYNLTLCLAKLLFQLFQFPITSLWLPSFVKRLQQAVTFITIIKDKIFRSVYVVYRSCKVLRGNCSVSQLVWLWPTAHLQSVLGYLILIDGNCQRHVCMNEYVHDVVAYVLIDKCRFLITYTTCITKVFPHRR